MRALKVLLHLARMHKLPSRAFLKILKYISLPRNIMENSISTETEDFASTHHGRAREEDNNYCFRRVLSVGVIDDQPISDDYINGERGIGGRDDAALDDSSPGRRKDRRSPAVPSTAPRIFQTIFLPNTNLFCECF